MNVNFNTLSLEKLITNTKKALLIGIGGGGDIVGTLPTAGLFKMFGIQCYFAGLPWERSVIDPVPGPRSYEQVRNIKKFNEWIWIANPETCTDKGIKFAESLFSGLIKNDVYLIDLSCGTRGISAGLEDLTGKLDIDLIVGIDVGGDCISFGNEPGLQSPLADSMMVAALYNLSGSIKTVIGLFGCGSDGELSFNELENSLSTIANHGGYYGAWGITGNILKKMQRAVAIIPTEASRVGVNASVGELNSSKIRSGTMEIEPVFSSNVTYYLSTSVIYENISVTARKVRYTKTFDEANLELNRFGLTTEYDLEMKKLNDSVKSGRK